jgi:hypothetical protein
MMTGRTWILALRVTVFAALMATYLTVVTLVDGWYGLKWSSKNLYAHYKDPLSIIHHFILAFSISAVVTLLNRRNIHQVSTLVLSTGIGYVVGTMSFFWPTTTPPYYPTDTDPSAQIAFLFGLLGMAYGVVRLDVQPLPSEKGLSRNDRQLEREQR